jgi:hypothetical protein
MLSSPEAVDALALVMTTSRSSPLMQLPQAVERQFASEADASQSRSQAALEAAAAQRLLLQALPTVSSLGGSRWHNERQKLLQGCFTTDPVRAHSLSISKWLDCA